MDSIEDNGTDDGEKSSQVKVERTTTITTQPAYVPALPSSLRYIMAGLLIFSVMAAFVVAFVRQNGNKPVAAQNTSQDCKDPVTENRLLQSVRQNPSDYAAQMDWGAYNLRCKQDYTAAVSAFEVAKSIIAKTPDNFTQDDRLEAGLSLGLAYLYGQRLKQAEVEFRAVLNEKPDNELAEFYLGSTLFLSDPVQARAYLEKVVQSGANTELGKLAQQLIDELNNKNNKPTQAPTTKS